MLARVRSLLRALLSRRRFEAGMTEELRFHIDQYTEDLVRSGVPVEEAGRRARLEFGGINTVEEDCREARGLKVFDEARRELRYAGRQLRGNPGFTSAVILTLALAIGANSAIFSIVNALLLKSPPYVHAERMGTIYTRVTGPRGYDARHNLDGEQWELLRDHVPALISAVSTRGTSGANLEAGSHVQFLHAARISAHYLDVLGLQPALGRNFSEDEDRPHAPNSAILSYSLWRNVFGSSPDTLGHSILLKGEPYSVIGILPEGATTPLNADLYTAIQAGREGAGAGTNFEAIIRLRDGATWQEADAELNRAWSLRTGRYELKDNPGAQVSFYCVPLQKAETAQLRPQALTLMLAAILILLIACANLAGVTLVRMMRRAPEVATRLALGATRWQIQKQFWIENLLLALAGGAVGMGVGWAALRGLLLLLPEHFLPVARIPLDGRVLAFTLAVSLFTSVLFGMLPALAARKVDLRSSMSSRAVAGAGSQTLREALIAGEVALTVVLLTASGLLIRSLIHLETLPPGFNPNGVIVAKASLDDVRFHDPAGLRKLLEESTAAMRQIPGVQNAAVGISLPFERAPISGDLTISDGPAAGRQVETDMVFVTPGYFEALQIPGLVGRSFTERDGPDAQRVAVINQTFARKFFYGVNPLGHYLEKNLLIVGVVADVAVPPGVDAAAPLTGEQAVYIPYRQVDAQTLSLAHAWFQPSWVVRTAGPVEGLTGEMQRALAGVDPTLPFSGFYAMRDLQAKTLAAQRIEVALLGAMAALALLLSAVGIFALVANLVAQRTREIGIRLALGATVQNAVVQVGRPGVGASALGLVLGLILGAGALRVLRSALYGVDIYDPLTILAVALTLAAVTLVATIVPTLKVARIDPAATLREE